jgi:hypothetical protein
MASTSRNAGAAAEPRAAQSTPDEASGEPRYSVDDLAEMARSTLGVSPHVVRGALADAGTKTFTVSQAASKVAKFGSVPAVEAE